MHMRRPAVLFGETVTQAFQRGFDQLGELLALTLGPTQGHILNWREVGGVESLLSSADIARRIVALPDSAANVGAMLMRNLAWRVHRRAGDGVATTAVLAQAILHAAARYVQAGGDLVAIRRGLERATRVASADIAAQAQTISADEETLSRVAMTITRAPHLSLILGEMFDVLGPLAHITVEDYVAPYLDRAYYDGGRWVARLESPYLHTDTVGRRAVQDDCHVLIFAGRLQTFEAVAPLLKLMDRVERRKLLLVAHEVSGPALNALVINHQRHALGAIAVVLQRRADLRAIDMDDLALLTGATRFDADLGQTLERVTPGDLGRARRAEATNSALVVSGGGGSLVARRERIEALRERLASLPDLDEEGAELRLRLARLAGGVGVLQIGAYSKVERDQLHQQAERAIQALRLATAEGVVPGGGVAYLQAIPAVQQLARELDGDEAYGATILTLALEAPFCRIVHNRGTVDPPMALAELRREGTGGVYDVVAERIVPATDLPDPAGVLRIALETAVSGAVLALSTSVLVLRRKPEYSSEP
jgi:chaperonin GroEL